MDDRKPMKYNKMHLDVLSGVIPIESVHGRALNKIWSIASCDGDEAALATVEKEFKRRQEAKTVPREKPSTKSAKTKPKEEIPIGPKPYSEKQMRVLNGEVPLEEAGGKLLSDLHKRALENRDTDLAEKIKAQIDFLHERRVELNVKRNRERRKRAAVGELPQWEQPKSNEYSEYEKKVICDEIPLKDVHTNTLVSIHLKAKNLGNHELAEAMSDLLIDRYATTLQKQRNKRNHLWRKSFDDSYYDKDSPLTQVQQQLLKGDLHLSAVEEDELELMLQKLEKAGRKEEARRVEGMLKQKRNPGWNSPIKTHEEALQCFEELFHTKLRRPKEWFAERKTK